ncbi:hypothetical protein QQ020_23585 [Fulvivirgaceae bacterium BMA12]|uniref:Uncharacterized protein n=1 Tax=Agaribacillus aureus TaxID=3051825 RepID=A0ABT8LBD2_9BACT|nr:hypothetical protein [Fulvivirgaceae bacterium BMA12]
MNPGRQIKALSMLFIMLIVMVHNVFPHVHHQHDHVTTAVSEGEFHHHEHHGDHHHPDEDDQDHEQKNLLDFLFKNHSHSKHTHQYTPATVKYVKSIKQLDVRVFVYSDDWKLDLVCVDTGLQRYVLFENPVSEHLYLRTYSHRGPPSLG